MTFDFTVILPSVLIIVAINGLGTGHCFGMSGNTGNVVAVTEPYQFNMDELALNLVAELNNGHHVIAVGR